MLELTEALPRRAAGLTADGKQKISMGRGLVREDVNVIMFDEPLTVIDPHLKWKLRSKLKELQLRVGVTMIYVTHDQTEALTFADQVVVMNEGEVVQIGSPVDLFERPAHTFVGHFIGSPGMNILPCEIRDGGAVFAGLAGRHRQPRRARRPQRDRRPPRVRLARRRRHPGRGAARRRHRPLPRRSPPRPPASASTRSCPRARRSPPARRISPSRRRRPASTSTAGWRRDGDEDREPEGLVVRAAGGAARRLQRADPADDRGQLLGAGDLRRQRLRLVRRALVRAGAALRALPRRAAAQPALHRARPR